MVAIAFHGGEMQDVRSYESLRGENDLARQSSSIQDRSTDFSKLASASAGIVLLNSIPFAAR